MVSTVHPYLVQASVQATRFSVNSKLSPRELQFLKPHSDDTANAIHYWQWDSFPRVVDDLWIPVYATAGIGTHPLRRRFFGHARILSTLNSTWCSALCKTPPRQFDQRPPIPRKYDGDQRLINAGTLATDSYNLVVCTSSIQLPLANVENIVWMRLHVVLIYWRYIIFRL